MPRPKIMLLTILESYNFVTKFLILLVLTSLSNTVFADSFSRYYYQCKDWGTDRNVIHSPEYDTLYSTVSAYVACEDHYKKHQKPGTSIIEYRNLGSTSNSSMGDLYLTLYGKNGDEHFGNLFAVGSNKKCVPNQLFNPYHPNPGGFPGQCEVFICATGQAWIPPDGQCGQFTEFPPEEDNGGGCVGNPCNPSTGNKYQPETDYQSVVNLEIKRSYNSRMSQDFGFGVGWSSNLFKSLTVKSNELYVWQASGRGEIFTGSSGNWSGDADTDLSITESNGFVLTNNNGHIETYGVNGKLLGETTVADLNTTYTPNGSGKLVTVTNHFGHTLTLTWDNDHVETITTPENQTYTYNYEQYGRLVGVTYPDGTTRQYHYEDANHFYALTGITDENGVRYATFAYDSQGRAISTEHADIGGGSAQEKFQINYSQ